MDNKVRVIYYPCIYARFGGGGGDRGRDHRVPFYMKALSYKEKVYYIYFPVHAILLPTINNDHSPLNCMLAVTSYACSYTCINL